MKTNSIFDPKRYERNGGKIIDVEPYELIPAKEKRKKRKHRINIKLIAFIFMIIVIATVTQTSILLSIAGFLLATL